VGIVPDDDDWEHEVVVERAADGTPEIA